MEESGERGKRSKLAPQVEEAEPSLTKGALSPTGHMMKGKSCAAYLPMKLMGSVSFVEAAVFFRIPTFLQLSFRALSVAFMASTLAVVSRLLSMVLYKVMATSLKRQWRMHR